LIKYWSIAKKAARVISKALMNGSGETGIYYDDQGHPMLAPLVRDPKFTARVVAEARFADGSSKMNGGWMTLLPV
jgi:hypothetical protein